MLNQSTSSPQNEQQCAADMQQPTSQGSTTQWRNQGRDLGEPDTPPPLLIFRLKWGLKGSKNFVGRPPPPPPPPYRKVWIRLDPALQHETNNKTLHHEHSKSFPTHTSQINPVGFFPRKLLNTLNVPVLWIFQHVFFETRTGDLSY